MVKRKVAVTIDVPESELLRFFADAITGEARAAVGKQRTFYNTLGNLVGITDVEAVKKANAKAKNLYVKITTKEFRKWLPEVFSEFARRAMEK